MTTSAVLASVVTSISKRLFHSPPNNISLQRIVGIVGRAHYESAALSATFTAAALVPKIATHPGTVTRIYAVLGSRAAWGVGEHIVLDVLKNGTSVLKSTIQVGDTTQAAQGVYDLTGSLDPAQASVAMGDEWTTTGTYTAGSGAGQPDIAILVEWGSTGAQ